MQSDKGMAASCASRKHLIFRRKESSSGSLSVSFSVGRLLDLFLWDAREIRTLSASRRILKRGFFNETQLLWSCLLITRGGSASCVWGRGEGGRRWGRGGGGEEWGGGRNGEEGGEGRSGEEWGGGTSGEEGRVGRSGEEGGESGSRQRARPRMPSLNRHAIIVSDPFLSRVVVDPHFPSFNVLRCPIS